MRRRIKQQSRANTARAFETAVVDSVEHHMLESNSAARVGGLHSAESVGDGEEQGTGTGSPNRGGMAGGLPTRFGSSDGGGRAGAGGGRTPARTSTPTDCPTSTIVGAASCDPTQVKQSKNQGSPATNNP
jgi:hypothetical protein